MIKYGLGALIYCMSSISLACSLAAPTNDVNFCSSFKTAATCYCTSSGLPSMMCQDMNALYSRMMLVFGTLQRACDFQKHTSAQNCLDNWNCYLHGGKDSQNRNCSGTGSACV
jgi:hypothetical protein